MEIPDNIVRQTVILSERYITDRFAGQGDRPSGRGLLDLNLRTKRSHGTHLRNDDDTRKK